MRSSMTMFATVGMLATTVVAAPLPFGDDPEPSIKLQKLGSYETGIFDGSAAEIPAYDTITQRLFVVNFALSRIDVLNVSNPASPQFLFAIPTADLGGAPNSVAVSNGLVVVAIENTPKTDPGTVAFYNADGQLLNALTAGALPDMVTFTPDGTKVLVANEGEPNDEYTIDPEGSVSIVDISGGVEALTDDDVVTAGFTAFNDQIDELRAAGVRIFGPGATVAQDVEPEYIAVSADSTTAFICLQENNAIAVLDIATATITDIMPLGFKEHARGEVVLNAYTFGSMPLLGTTDAGQDIFLGGFSGLYFDGLNPDNGNLQFIAHPDRGPNGEPIDVTGDGNPDRPFPLPDYQPRLVFFELDQQSGELLITDQLPLSRADGTPLTGRPNMLATELGLAFHDETPIDLFGNVLDLDPYGADFEGVVRGPDGTFWMVDEYRPAIYHFDTDGVLVARYVPEGSNDSGVDVGIEALPAVYAQRRLNRGFEAVAYQNGKIYAFVQSPLDNPDVPNDDNSKNSDYTRILEFDIATQTTTAEYLYVLEGDGSDKIGDAVSLRTNEFLVIERDSSIGTESNKNVFQINIDNATNLQMLDESIAGPGGALELMTLEELNAAGIVPVTKDLYVDLIAAGYDSVDKPEGLAMIHPGLIAVVNDNDFQIAGGFDIKTGLLDENPNPQPTILGLISFTGNGFDASNQDDAINIVNWPTFGMYLPDAIATYEVGGQTYIVTANEGDARDYDGYSEEARINDVELCPVAFPTRDWLKQNKNLGRLNITTSLGDINGDGMLEQIFSYGARSFSIWSADGELIFDSADEFEQITAIAFPNDFNSNNDENDSFDARSDDKGPEPEGVAIGQIDGRWYAFIGLERIGGIMVYDITDPTQPEFLQYLNNRDFAGDAEQGTAGDLGAEGLIFIDAADSPTGTPLLVVANEVSGSTTIFQIAQVDQPCPTLVGDINLDCAVDMNDVASLLANWGGSGVGDINGDGIVDGADLALMLGNWTE